MEIKEAIALYEFLGNINGTTFFGIYVLLMITLYAVIIPATDKLGIKTKTNGYKVVLILFAVLITISLSLIYREARSKTELRSIGIKVKTEIVSTGFTQKPFSQITSVIGDTASKLEVLHKYELLRKLAKEFPNEFMIIKMPYPLSNNVLDSNGIALIDDKALEPIYKSIDEKAKLTAPLIKKLLLDNGIDILYTDETNHKYSIQANIDNAGWLIGQDYFKALIGQESLFPVYNADHRIIGFTLMVNKQP